MELILVYDDAQFCMHGAECPSGREGRILSLRNLKMTFTIPSHVSFRYTSVKLILVYDDAQFYMRGKRYAQEGGRFYLPTCRQTEH